MVVRYSICTVSHFRPSLIFASTAASYPSRAPYTALLPADVTGDHRYLRKVYCQSKNPLQLEWACACACAWSSDVPTLTAKCL